MRSRVRDWRPVRLLLDNDPVLAVGLGLCFLVVPPLQGRILPSIGSGVQLTSADVALTVVCAAALAWRRRYPLPVLVVTAAATCVTVALDQQVNLAQLGLSIAIVTLAWHRPRSQVLIAVGATTVALQTTSVLSALNTEGFWRREDVLLWVWLVTAAALAVQARRETTTALRDRALRAEESREETALRRVAEERVRIARELHDVIAHHVAVIGVQAGVAQHVLDRDPAAAHEALGHVRGSAKSVLAELQDVLRVLRGADGNPATAPAPGLADLPALIDTTRRAGIALSFESVGAEAAHPGPAVQLTVYRIVQEALTNVRKHAPSAATRVVLQGDADRLEVSVVNDAPLLTGVTSDPAGGSGLGLVGMRERVTAVGGRLETGTRPEGGFTVRADFPAGHSDGPAVPGPSQTQEDS